MYMVFGSISTYDVLYLLMNFHLIYFSDLLPGRMNLENSISNFKFCGFLNSFSSSLRIQHKQKQQQRMNQKLNQK